MDDFEKLEMEFEVASYESDLNGRMSLFALFNRFQYLAEKHAEILKVGYTVLRESNLGFILSRINLKINSLPKWGEAVKLRTWPKGVERLFAVRDFYLLNEKDEVLVAASTAWLLVDIEKGKPKKIESLPIDLTFSGAPHAIDGVPDKIPLPQSIIPVYEKQIWLSDIDTNQHVNNAQYAKWITDCFSSDRFREERISSLQINFLEETLLGDIIHLYYAQGENDSEYFVCGKSGLKEKFVFNSRVLWHK